MQNYIQPGHTLTLTAPSGGVTGGTGYKIGQLFVVAVDDADEGDPFEGKTDGVYTLPKTTGQAWTEGALLYWDDSADKATTTAEDNLLIGCATEAADSGDTTGPVRLNGVVRQNGNVADNAVDTDAIADDAVTTAKIADGAVFFAQTKMFVSTEQTGNGSAQSVAHGLAATPAAVLIVPTDTAPATTGAYTATEGTHTSTNVVVTVTAGKKYKVWAMA